MVGFLKKSEITFAVLSETIHASKKSTLSYKLFHIKSLTTLAVNGSTAPVNDLHTLQLKIHQGHTCIRQWFKSHSYHNTLPQSSCLDPECHVFSLSNVVMMQKPAKLYKFLEIYYPLVYNSPIRGNSSPSISSWAPFSIPSSSLLAEHTTPSCMDCSCSQLLAPPTRCKDPLCHSPVPYLFCAVLTNFLWTTMQIISYFTAECIDPWSDWFA